jgi:hypothetical protein
VHCGKPIGYGAPMHLLPDDKGLSHADCEMKAAESEARP